MSCSVTRISLFLLTSYKFICVKNIILFEYIFLNFLCSALVPSILRFPHLVLPSHQRFYTSFLLSFRFASRLVILLPFCSHFHSNVFLAQLRLLLTVFLRYSPSSLFFGPLNSSYNLSLEHCQLLFNYFSCLSQKSRPVLLQLVYFHFSILTKSFAFYEHFIHKKVFRPACILWLVSVHFSFLLSTIVSKHFILFPLL